MLIAEDKQAIDVWVRKFPDKKGAVLMALRIVQDRIGWLPKEALQGVSEYLEIPVVDVYEVASFYTMYRNKPTGKHQLKVCLGLSCCLAGAEEVMSFLHKRVKSVTLSETECLGACHKAPCAILDDHDYQERLTPESLEKLLAQLETDQ